MIHEVKHSVETVFDVLRTKVGVTFVLLPDEATQKSHVNLKETRLMDECFRVFSCDSLRGCVRPFVTSRRSAMGFEMRPRISIRGSVRPSVTRFFSMSRLWEKMVGNDLGNILNAPNS